MRKSVAFYTEILDFERLDKEEDLDDCAVIPLAREDAFIILSVGDGHFGTVLLVSTYDVDELFHKFRQRGLQTPGNPYAPKLVHEGPIDQTWGTREFYVEDPDGNTLRFTER
jgi:catechol 2,3-dioxygenase-like lactoylglutathione lyase family enzyme